VSRPFEDIRSDLMAAAERRTSAEAVAEQALQESADLVVALRDRLPVAEIARLARVSRPTVYAWFRIGS
jgi:AcrR family transcriptional regulator